MGVAGLADGFLAGFNTMDRYERGKKDDERMDKAMGLRDAAWQNELDRQKAADQRYKEESDYRKSRDKANDERYEKQFSLSEQRANSAERRAESQAAMAKQQFNWQREQQEKAAFQQEKLPILQAGWQNIVDKKPPGKKFLEVVSDKRASMFNPERYLQQDFADSGKIFVTYAGNLMRLAQEGKLDPATPEGHAAINNPKFIKAAGTLYQDEVNKGVGDIDPATGKTIKAKQLDNIMVTPDGRGIVLGVKVTYDDGSHAVHPVTDGRTSASDDHPKVIPINDFLKPAYQRAALSQHMIANADQIRTYLGLTAGPDMAGYKKAVTALEQQHGRNRARISASGAEDKDAQLDALDQQLDQSKAALAETYGVASKEAAPAASAPIKAWSGGDPDRIRFIQEADQNGKLGTLMDNPARMNAAFELWQQQAVKQRQQAQESATAASLRDARKEAYQAMSRQ